MQLTGGSWTIGTGNFDGINYGLFYSDRMMERIVSNVVSEVERLKGKKVLVGECGHATSERLVHSYILRRGSA